MPAGRLEVMRVEVCVFAFESKDCVQRRHHALADIVP